ncbi:REF/SRPP-like protein At1g67360 [Euphorbia lathyris]|uniref:REF/SRPP-like protein At1g67360 n=1 Tax=Euphorbia lathyris TaxID=212925 RepID=UPI0033144871
MEVDTQTKKMEAEKKKSPELKHLTLVRIAVIEVLIIVWKLYEYAKKNSGPLRSTVGTVEGAVTAVVGPVYQKHKDLPDNVLLFVDGKVDEGIQQFDKHAPPIAKKAASKAKAVADIALEKSEKLVNEARTGGPRAAAKYAAAESKHLAINQSVKLYIKLDHLPVIHTMLDITLPTAAHWSEKYNQIVKILIQKGYAIFGYLPLVPIDEITKTYKQKKPEEKEDAAEKKSDSSSDSD